MRILLEHVIPLGEALDTDTPRVRRIKAQYHTVTVMVRYDVTYHYDPGGWTSYGGDPPSFELDVNKAEVDDWSIDDDKDGVESPMLTDEMVQRLYDVWAGQHGADIEADLVDKLADWGAEDGE